MTDFHSFLNPSNCNTREMTFCEQRDLKVKHQVSAVRRNRLSLESHPRCSIHHTANTGKFPFGDVASPAVQRASATLGLLWLNETLFPDQIQSALGLRVKKAQTVMKTGITLLSAGVQSAVNAHVHGNVLVSRQSRNTLELKQLGVFFP